MGALSGVIAACSAPAAALPPTLPAAPTATPATATATVPAPTATPIVLTPTLAPRPAPAAALPTVEASRGGGETGFLTPVELDLQLAQPLSNAQELQSLVNGMLQLQGVSSVRSDGTHITLRYDSTQVLPARIRDRLRELGHPATAGTEVQNPGDAAD